MSKTETGVDVVKWFYNLKTSVKLVSAFVVIALILAFVGWSGLNNLSTVNSALNEMYDDNLVPVANLSEAKAEYQKLQVFIRDMAYVAETDAENKLYQEELQASKTAIETSMDQYRKMDLTPEDLDIVNKFTSTWEAFKQLLDKAIAINLQNDKEAFEELLKGELSTVGDQAQQDLVELVNHNVKLADQTAEDSAALYAASRNTILIIIFIAFAISIGFGFYISQIIARPLRNTVELVGKVANGDLREMSRIDTKDEVGLLAASVNRMIESLRHTVDNIQSSAMSVSAAAEQISASTEEVASGSASQADAAQTMNELFKELSEAIGSVARNAEQASELSTRTSEIAREGSKVVRLSVEGMKQVNEQMTRLAQDSNQIGEIIEVIDDIAEQTNLLALNAAIEAARAGDQGRGFAVVADEVRKLAERSGEATKQITAIIKGMQENTKRSVNAVAEGVQSTQNTGTAFENIATMVNDSASKVGEIAAASEEQAAQSSEVLSSIESISAATEEAAASSQETASTAQSLANLAEQLNQAVAIFRTR